MQRYFQGGNKFKKYRILKLYPPCIDVDSTLYAPRSWSTETIPEQQRRNVIEFPEFVISGSKQGRGAQLLSWGHLNVTLSYWFAPEAEQYFIFLAEEKPLTNQLTE